RRHRRGHAGRLQLPDGAAGPARPRGPRHVGRHPRRALRGVPRPELRAGPAAAPHGVGRPPGAEVGQGLLRLQLTGRRRGRVPRRRPPATPPSPGRGAPARVAAPHSGGCPACPSRPSSTVRPGPAQGRTATPRPAAQPPPPSGPGWMPRLPVPTCRDRAARSGAGPDGAPEPGGEAGADERRRAQITALAASARRAGRGAVASGRWLAETVLDVAPRLPVRDAETL